MRSLALAAFMVLLLSDGNARADNFPSRPVTIPAPPAPGSGSHIAGLYFENVAGIRLQYVPYRGTGLAMNDLVAGQIDLIIDQISNSIAQVRAGTIRAYAVTGDKRPESASDGPTTDEAVWPDFT